MSCIYFDSTKDEEKSERAREQKNTHEHDDIANQANRVYNVTMVTST